MATPKLTTFAAAFKAEHIKKKGTGIYVMSALTGALFPVMTLLIIVYRNVQQAKPFAYSFYLNFITESTIPFAGFFFPLLLILLTSRITQLDHRNGGWRLMEMQPLTKSAIYFSKFSIVLISSAIAISALILSGLGVGWVAIKLTGVPSNALLDIPYPPLIQLAARLFMASLYVAAVQYVIAVLIPGFIWPILLGFGALLGGSLLKSQGINLDWYPYHILSRDYSVVSDLGYWFTYTDGICLCAAVILLYIGFQWYRHKTIKRAFAGQPIQVLSLAAVLAVFGGMLAYLLMPKTAQPYKTTVLAGEIDTSLPLDMVYVINPVLHDTLASIPVEANAFHHVFVADIAADYYVVIFGDYFGEQVYFGKADSLYVKGRLNEQANEIKITGTRLAENQLAPPAQRRSIVDYYLQQNMYLDNPRHFSEVVHQEWEKAVRGRKRFKTADGYTTRDDFNARLDKLLAVQYLNYWSAYQQKRLAAFPAETTGLPPAIQEISNRVSLTDGQLLGNEAYMDYVVHQLTVANQADIGQDIKALEGIKTLPRSDFRNKAFYWQLNKSLSSITDGSERTVLMDEYAGLISDEQLRVRLTQAYFRLQRLNAGAPAPVFRAVDLTGNRVSLTDLSGQYLLIDVWASWCAPCKKLSPLFEKLAIKYKDQPVRFLALSVDRDERKWRIDAGNRSQSVLQWRVLDNETFGRSYMASVIPQFIFIDPAGRLIHTKMPLPSESAFEFLLRNELGLSN